MAYTKTMSFSIDETVEPLIKPLVEKLGFRSKSALINKLIVDSAKKHKVEAKK